MENTHAYSTNSFFNKALNAHVETAPISYSPTFRDDLSFAGKPLLTGRHRIHKYPAMLHPLLVDHLLNKYSRTGDIVFDPFCGSGVTLLQAALKGYTSIGFDINPLALLIAKAKTTSFVTHELHRDFIALHKDILACNNTDVPAIYNIDYWYTEGVQEGLGKIRHVLKNNRYKYNILWVVCLALMAREHSNTRNGEFKRYRVKELSFDLPHYVLSSFFKCAEKAIDLLTKGPFPQAKATPFLFNSEHSISSSTTYDLVITSPPYGDSNTTVAYGQFSSFGQDWTADLNPFGQISYRIDAESIGKKSHVLPQVVNNTLLQETLSQIRQGKKEKRAKEVLHFFNGYYKVLRNTIENLRDKGRICFVVGNRRVNGVQIPMDQITVSFFKVLGLHIEDLFTRRIHNKVMPIKNSPTNQKNLTAPTMSHEYIVVGKKSNQ